MTSRTTLALLAATVLTRVTFQVMVDCPVLPTTQILGTYTTEMSGGTGWISGPHAHGGSITILPAGLLTDLRNFLQGACEDMQDDLTP